MPLQPTQVTGHAIGAAVIAATAAVSALLCLGVPAYLAHVPLETRAVLGSGTMGG